MLTYLKGDATCPVGEGPKLLIHICNTRGGWGKGFVLAVSKKWPGPEKAYREWFKIGAHPVWGTFELGNIQIIKVLPDLSVINMIAQEGYGKGNLNLHRTSEPDSKPPIRYDALEKCLGKVAEAARTQGASIHGPRFGTNLAGGSWDVIGSMLDRQTSGVPVTIYDF